jgi:hypothetical protein
MSKKRKKPAASEKPLYRLRSDDDWKPRGNKAKGDNRPYVTTNKGTMPGLPQTDDYDPGAAWWGNKRIYLGDKPKGRYRRKVVPGAKTQLWKLFEVLSPSPGRWHSVAEIHEKVFGSSVSLAEMKRAAQNVRRVVSKLKRRMAEYKVDEDAILIAKSYNRQPGYMVVLLADQEYPEGQKPWPELHYTDREDRALDRVLKRKLGQEDEYPSGVVFWGDSAQIRLGEVSYLRKLFHFLADRPGRFRPVSEIEGFVFGTNCDTSTGVSEAEMSKTQQKIRRLISRLTERMRDSGLEDEAIIVPHHYCHQPGYILLLIPEQKVEKVQSPQPVTGTCSNL